MSHFTVTVLYPAEVLDGLVSLSDYLDRVMARYDEDREVERHVDEETGESWWSNPEAKWDWWSVGGRWRGYFIPLVDADPVALVFGTSGAFDNVAKTYVDEHGRAVARPDGGPLALLDLPRMRLERRNAALADWDAYARVTAGTSEPLPWSAFYDRFEASRRALEILREAGDDVQDPSPYTIQDARRDYAAQPRVRAIRESAEFSFDKWGISDPVSYFEGVSRETYGRRAADRAVPGYATVTLDGEWHAPGEMGWFGLSDDDATSFELYARTVNDLLDAYVRDDANVGIVALDCHI